MEEMRIRQKIIEATATKFEADNGNDIHMNIFITNGEIVRTDSWSSSGLYIKYKGHPNFVIACCNAIHFIAHRTPKELKNIYYALSDETMKNYCRKIQQEMIAQLQF